MSDNYVELLQQENYKLIVERDNLLKDVEMKGNLIVKFLELITETGDENLRTKAILLMAEK